MEMCETCLFLHGTDTEYLVNLSQLYADVVSHDHNLLVISLILILFLRHVIPLPFLQFFYISHSFVCWFLFPYFILNTATFQWVPFQFFVIHLFHFLIKSFFPFPSIFYVGLTHSFIKSLVLYFPNFKQKRGS